MLLNFPRFSLIFLLFLSTDVKSGRTLALFFAVQTFSSIKCRTAFKNNCTEQNAINKGKIGQMPRSTRCMSEFRESHLSKMKQQNFKTSLTFPDFSYILLSSLVFPEFPDLVATLVYYATWTSLCHSCCNSAHFISFHTSKRLLTQKCYRENIAHSNEKELESKEEYLDEEKMDSSLV